jgi:hypothetical protein
VGPEVTVIGGSAKCTLYAYSTLSWVAGPGQPRLYQLLRNKQQSNRSYISIALHRAAFFALLDLVALTRPSQRAWLAEGEIVLLVGGFRTFAYNLTAVCLARRLVHCMDSMVMSTPTATTDASLEAPAPMEGDLERHIRLAVEHLFEEAYAAVDEEFLSMLRSNRQGWVPVDSICTHLHVGPGTIVDGTAIKTAARCSNILVLNETEATIRRKTPMRKITLNGTQNRTGMSTQTSQRCPFIR